MKEEPDDKVSGERQGLFQAPEAHDGFKRPVFWWGEGGPEGADGVRRNQGGLVLGKKKLKWSKPVYKPPSDLGHCV